MTGTDLRKKSVSDLQKQELKLRDEITELKRQKTLSNAEKNKFKVAGLKKQLARVLTVINEKNSEETKKETAK